MVVSTNLQNTAVKYAKELHMVLLISLKDQLEKYFTVRDGIKNEQMLTTLFASLVTEPYKGTVNPATLSALNLTARKIKTYLNQTVAEEDSRQLISIAEEIVGDVKIATGSKNPLELAILSVMMAKKGRQLAGVIYSASYNAAGTTIATCFNGFDTITLAEVTANALSVANGNYGVVSAALTTSNIGDQIIGLVDNNVNDDLKAEETGILQLHMSGSHSRMYDDWYLNTFGTVSYNNAYKKRWLHGYEDKIEIVTPIGKKNSPYFHLTRKENLVVGMDTLSNENKIEVFRASAFKDQFVNVANIGCEFVSLQPEDIFVIKNTP